MQQNNKHATKIFFTSIFNFPKQIILSTTIFKNNAIYILSYITLVPYYCGVKTLIVPLFVIAEYFHRDYFPFCPPPDLCSPTLPHHFSIGHFASS